MTNDQYDKLLAACKSAHTLLGMIPAFGDTIGDKINKPTIGIVHNQLKAAIEACEPYTDEASREWFQGKA